MNRPQDDHQPPSFTQPPMPTPGPRGWTRKRKQFAGFIVVLAVVSVAYRLVYTTGLQRTAALYVGIPALLAIGLSFLPRSGSAIGSIIKGSTLAVVAACVILPEGLLCLLFVLPIIVVISIIVGGIIDATRDRVNSRRSRMMAVGLPLLVLSSEGVIGSPFDSRDAVVASIIVEASPAEVAMALAATPDFATELPTFLKVGFNRPVSATGSGLDVGDERVINFSGGSHDQHPLGVFGIGSDSHDHLSQMHLAVTASESGRAVFDVLHDGTMTSRWLRLDQAIVTWTAVDAQHTRVEWRFEYERLLSPTAYFGPLQRFGMSHAANYLLDAVVVAHLR
jgi:hypothetical protein